MSPLGNTGSLGGSSVPAHDIPIKSGPVNSHTAWSPA